MFFSSQLSTIKLVILSNDEFPVSLMSSPNKSQSRSLPELCIINVVGWGNHLMQICILLFTKPLEQKHISPIESWLYLALSDKMSRRYHVWWWCLDFIINGDKMSRLIMYGDKMSRLLDFIMSGHKMSRLYHVWWWCLDFIMSGDKMSRLIMIGDMSRLIMYGDKMSWLYLQW